MAPKKDNPEIYQMWYGNGENQKELGRYLFQPDTSPHYNARCWDSKLISIDQTMM